MDTLPRNLIQQRRRLRRVMEHIGENLGRDLSLGELAQVACWSPEHFDRVYRRSIGEPPMATLRRLRLQAAAHALAAGLPLAEAARRAGYGSTQAFGRAFARQHGLLPGAWLRGCRGLPPPAPFALVRLDEAGPCHVLPYRGDAQGVSGLFDITVERLQRSDAPVLRHFDTDPAHTAPQERREWLYLPLARR
jgi:AraC-like DNA-binding protein